MDKVQININTPVKSYEELSGFNIEESGSSLVLTFENVGDVIGLKKGEIIILRRYLYGENGIPEIIELNLTILDIDYVNRKVFLPSVDGYSVYIKKIYSSNIDTGSTIVEFEEPHNIFFQDSFINPMTFYNIDGDELFSIENGNYTVHCMTKYSHSPVASNEYYRFLYDEVNCDDDEEIYEYIYLPESISRNHLLLSGVSRTILEDAKYVSFKYNPFYYTSSTNQGLLWRDTFYGRLLDYLNIEREKESRVVFLKKCNYWSIGIDLNSDSNESELGYEDSYNVSLLDEIIEDLMPGTIDMERLKYQPIIVNEDSYEMATGLTFYFHFRKRKEIPDEERIIANSRLTSGNVYYDSWFIDEDSNDTWWNGYSVGNITDENYEDNFKEDKFEEFYNNNGIKSDLLAYLNFTDNDIYFRKKKVAKTFIRLSFYTSKDPIEQKLLFYSTVFLDGGELYGKYIKQLAFMREEEKKKTTPSFVSETEDGKDEVNEVVKVISIDNSLNGIDPNRIDSKIEITNEYNRFKSSEGFNIYLFAEDQRALNENIENSGRTIYMKVEFNHAGNGKTIPMIMWPKEGHNFIPLTIENFVENLYIPVNISYLKNEDKYVYNIPNAMNNDGNIGLILFEPKLSNLPDNNV